VTVLAEPLHIGHPFIPPHTSPVNAVLSPLYALLCIYSIALPALCQASTPAPAGPCHSPVVNPTNPQHHHHPLHSDRSEPPPSFRPEPTTSVIPTGANHLRHSDRSQPPPSFRPERSEVEESRASTSEISRLPTVARNDGVGVYGRSKRRRGACGRLRWRRGAYGGSRWRRGDLRSL